MTVIPQRNGPISAAFCDAHAWGYGVPILVLTPTPTLPPKGTGDEHVEEPYYMSNLFCIFIDIVTKLKYFVLNN